MALSMPVSRRQDWKVWDRELIQLEEKLRKLKADIEEARDRVANPS